MSTNQIFYPTVAVGNVTFGSSGVQCQLSLGINFPDIKLRIPCKTWVKIVKSSSTGLMAHLAIFKILKTEVESSDTAKSSKQPGSSKARKKF